MKDKLSLWLTKAKYFLASHRWLELALPLAALSILTPLAAVPLGGTVLWPIVGLWLTLDVLTAWVIQRGGATGYVGRLFAGFHIGFDLGFAGVVASALLGGGLLVSAVCLLVSCTLAIAGALTYNSWAERLLVETEPPTEAGSACIAELLPA